MAVEYNVNDVLPLVDQEVLVSLDPDAKVGDNGLFGPEWYTVGILTEDSELSISRAVDEETIAGKGRGVLARRYKAGDLTGQYEVLSRNAMTDYIAFPDAVVSGNVRLERHTSKVAMLMTAFVDIRDDGVVDIRVTRIPASHRFDTIGRAETPAGAQVTVGFRPDDDKVVFEKVSFRVNEDGSMTDITPRVIIDQDEIAEDEDNYQVGDGQPDGVLEPSSLDAIAASVADDEPEPEPDPSA